MAYSVTSAPVPLFMDHLQEFRVIYDSIHGHIELHPLIVKIIDTPSFQRLRYIAQLGGCYYVFPGATHKRFEHCIGTCHLAGELVKTLYTLQPELGITQEDVLCVQIAGLCHDLGHGPFSHLFDMKFMDLFPNDKQEKWAHEIGSLAMFDYMIKCNNLREEFAKHNLGEKDINFIKTLIHSPRSKQGDKNETERGKDKIFLYEIVANKRNGIDVDRWDYFVRDAYNVGISNNFDHRRLMKFARVLDVEGEKQICWREKEVCNIYDMCHTRALLHRRVYQHKTSIAVESMIADAFVAANDWISLSTQNGKPCKLSEAVYDMSAYLKLTDNIYHQILYSSDEKLSTARKILERIERRDVYRVVGTVKRNGNIDKEKILDEVLSSYDDLKDYSLPRISRNDVEIHVVTLDYGMKDQNPIDEVCFYRKHQPDVPVKLEAEEVLHIMPSRFRDCSVKIYSKKTDPESLETVAKCFEAWCVRHKLKKDTS